MTRRFFRRHEGRGSYDLFSSYKHYLPGIGGVCALLAMFAIGALLGNLVTIALKFTLGDVFTANYGMLISYPVMFIPALLFASVQSRLSEYNTEGVALDSNEALKGRTLLYVFAGIFSTIAAAYVIEPVNSLLPPMPEALKAVFKQILEQTPFWATLVSVSLFAPLFEEWLCRGIVLRGLLKKVNPCSAIIISAAFFAVLHMNPWQAIPAFAIGLLFSYIYYRTGSLKLTMLMHCANNTLAAVLGRMPEFKDAETFMDILSPGAYWAIYVACVLIVICTFIVFTKHRSTSWTACQCTSEEH
jgi:membrane protease YdiL (CAAX protease family)